MPGHVGGSQKHCPWLGDSLKIVTKLQLGAILARSTTCLGAQKQSEGKEKDPSEGRATETFETLEFFESNIPAVPTPKKPKKSKHKLRLSIDDDVEMIYYEL